MSSPSQTQPSLRRTFLCRGLGVTLIIFSLASVLGCGNSGNSGSNKTSLEGSLVESKELIISVASSLMEPFEEIHREFERTTGSRVYGNYGSSQALISQALQGAPIDLLVTADPALLDGLERSGFIKGSPSLLGTNSLILVLNPEQNPSYTSLESLSFSEIVTHIREHSLRLATGNPQSVPLGAYAQAGVGSEQWSRLEDSLIYAKSAYTAEYYLLSGAVDGAILYGSSRQHLREGFFVYPIPLEQPITYMVAQLEAPSTSVHGESLDFQDSSTLKIERELLLGEYLNFLTTEGVEILDSYGISSGGGTNDS